MKRKFTRDFLSGVIVAIMILVSATTYAWDGNIIEGWLVDAGVLRPADSSWTVDVGNLTADTIIATTGTISTLVINTLSSSTVYRAGDGTSASTAYGFSSESGLGINRIGTNNLGVFANSTKIVDFSSTGVGALAHLPLTASSSILKGAVADGAGAVGTVNDNSIALTNATSLITSFRNAGTEKSSIDYLGLPHFGKNSTLADLITISQSGNNIIMTVRSSNGGNGYNLNSTVTVDSLASAALMSTGWPLVLQSGVADSATVKALVFKTANTLSTAGALHSVWRNGTTDISSIGMYGTYKQQTGTATTTDATTTTIKSYTLPVAGLYEFDIMAFASSTSGADYAVYDLRQAVSTNGTTATLLGSTVSLNTQEADATWNLSVEVSGNNLLCRAVGEAGNNIDWQCDIRFNKK